MDTDTKIIPKRILRELDSATRPPDIRPETVRDRIMYNAGMRQTFTLLCNKLNVRIDELTKEG